MRFDWDSQKAARNLTKHGVSFQEAATVFGDPDHSIDERRFLTIGASENNRLLIVSHADNGEIIRIISARELTRRERKLYEQG
ncbi:MAG: BrnT family toxin [Pyrinomonadaceae bacterium]